jgi:hypothetical protein
MSTDYRDLATLGFIGRVDHEVERLQAFQRFHEQTKVGLQ